MPRYPVPDRERRRWCIAPDLNEDALARLTGLSPEDAFGYTPQRVALAQCGVYDLADLARALPEELLSVPGVHPQAIPWWTLVIDAALAGRRPPIGLPGTIPPSPLRGYRRRPLPPAFAERMLGVSHVVLAPAGRALMAQGDRTLGQFCTEIETGRQDDDIAEPVLTLVKALLVAEAEDDLAAEPEGHGRYRLPFHVRPPGPRRRLSGTLTPLEQVGMDNLLIEDFRSNSVHVGRYGDWVDNPTLRAIDRLGLLTQLDLATLYTALGETRTTRSFLIGLHRIMLDVTDFGSGDAYLRAA